MTIKGLMKTLAAGLIMLTAMSCGGNKNLIDPKAMLSYGKEPNEQTMEVLSKNYSGVISKNRKSGITTPGIYSDYAVMLVKQGKRAEANGWFNKEMEAFPSSRGYVMQLKRRLIPEYQDNNSTSAADSDTTATEPDALTPAQRKRAEKRAAAVLNDTTETGKEMETNTETGTDTVIDGNAETEATDESTSAGQTDDEDMDRLSEPPANDETTKENPSAETPQQGNTENEKQKEENPMKETPQNSSESKQ